MGFQKNPPFKYVKPCVIEQFFIKRTKISFYNTYNIIDKGLKNEKRPSASKEKKQKAQTARF